MELPYTVGDEPLALRDIQLETDSCWCEDTSFVRTALGGLPHDEESSVGNETDPRLWFTVVFPKLTLYRAKKLEPEIGLMFPPDTWYYGCREDHLIETDYGHPTVHASMTILVGCARPQSIASIREGIYSIVSETIVPGVHVSAGPDHHTRDGDVSFLPVKVWVQSRIAFIDAACKSESPEGLHRGPIGFSGILRVLGKQFGSAAECIVAEMALAKQNSDEEAGNIAGGFAPVGIRNTLPNETIYVASAPEGSSVNPIEIA